MSKPQTETVPLPAAKRTKRFSIDYPLVNLPPDILENVFTFFPIKEAIQASTVSTRFKKSWHQNRIFNFREIALRYRTENLIAIIDGIFNSHNGEQIQTFKLLIDPIGAEEFISKWLKICIQKGIEELELHFLRSGYCLDADSVDKIKALRTLKLVHCDIQLPSVFKTMRFLNKLILWQLSLTEKTLETIMCYCKLLNTLDLFRCSTIRHVRIFAGDHKFLAVLKIALCIDLGAILIDAPSLRSMFYSGHIPNIKFRTKVELYEANVNFVPAGHRTYEKASLVERLIRDISNVTVLTTSALVPEGLAARFRGKEIGHPEYQLVNVREVQLFMHGGIFCNPFDVVMFIVHCPNLVRLFIDLNDYHCECGVYWELHQKPILEKLNNCFNKLKVVKLKGFKFFRSELELIKIILQKAKFLAMLVLVTPKNGRTKLLPEDAPKYNHLFLSWKASPTAKIFLYEHSHDKSFLCPTHPKVWY